MGRTACTEPQCLYKGALLRRIDRYMLNSKSLAEQLVHEDEGTTLPRTFSDCLPIKTE